MEKTRSMIRNQHHDDDEASFKSCAPWSHLDHNLLFIVMMKLGFGDFLSLTGVCKSWRLLALSNKKRFMESKPPMSMTISTDSNEKVCCCLEDFEGRKFKTILPDCAGGDFVGLTCGHLVFFKRKKLDFWLSNPDTNNTHDFWLLNPVTNNQLHFRDFPYDHHRRLVGRSILVFSASISRWVFVVIYKGEVWFCLEGKRAWKRVPFCVPIGDMNAFKGKIDDMYAFKGKVYTLMRLKKKNNPIGTKRNRLAELRLHPYPIITLLETRLPSYWEFHGPRMFVSSCDSLFVTDWDVKTLYKLDVGKMKWFEPYRMTLEEYAFFRNMNGERKRISYGLDCSVTAVKRESWADPRAHRRYAATYYGPTSNFFFYWKSMWYFPHERMNVNRIDG